MGPVPPDAALVAEIRALCRHERSVRLIGLPHGIGKRAIVPAVAIPGDTMLDPFDMGAWAPVPETAVG
jgi:hypothetical protein